MATNGNTGLYRFTTIDTFPLSETLSGTVASPNDSTAVTGVGTLFLTEIGGCNPNDLSTPNNNVALGYIWNGSTEWRKVTAILSDTILYISSPFTVSLAAGSTVRYIPASRVMALSYSDTGGGTGVVDGVALAANEGGGWQVSEFTNPPIVPHIFTAVDVTYSYT